MLFCFSISVLSPCIKSNENKKWDTISHLTCPRTFFILLFGDFCERGGRDKRKDFFSRFFFSFPLFLAPSSGQSIPRGFYFETRDPRIRVYTVWKCYESLEVSCKKQRKELNVGATFLRWFHFHYRNCSHQWTKAFVSAFPRMDIFIKFGFCFWFPFD